MDRAFAGTQAAGGVDLRRGFERDIRGAGQQCFVETAAFQQRQYAAVQRSRHAVGVLEQGGHRLQSQPHVDAVRPGERHAVADRSDRHGGNVTLGFCRVNAQLLSQFPHQRERHAGAAFVAVAESAVGQVRIHQRAAHGQFFAGQVVVGDDHCHPELVRAGRGFEGGDAVVHGHDQPGALLAQPLHRGGRDAVPFAEPVRNAVIHIRAGNIFEKMIQDRRSTDAVAVVIPEYGDPEPVVDRREDNIHRGLQRLVLRHGGQ